MTGRGHLTLAVDNGPAPAGAASDHEHNVRRRKLLTEALEHDQRRRAQLAAIHVARKQLGMVEDDYRALLERVTGHASAKECTGPQLDATIAEFRRMGFKGGRASSSTRMAEGSVARKARAMWISLYQLGAIDDPSDAALDAFGERQLGVQKLQWMSEQRGYRLVEALKAMADRHGWDQTVSSRLPTRERIRILKDRLVGAQLARLASAGVEVTGPLVADRAGWSDARLQSAAGELAARIRSIPKPN